MRYRVDISKDETLLFSISIENIDKEKREKNLELVLEKFPPEEGYHVQTLYSDHDIRYLKSTGDSIEILAALPVYEPIPHL